MDPFNPQPIKGMLSHCPLVHVCMLWSTDLYPITYTLDLAVLHGLCTYCSTAVQTESNADD